MWFNVEVESSKIFNFVYKKAYAEQKDVLISLKIWIVNQECTELWFVLFRVAFIKLMLTYFVNLTPQISAIFLIIILLPLIAVDQLDYMLQPLTMTKVVLRVNAWKEKLIQKNNIPLKRNKYPTFLYSVAPPSFPIILCKLWYKLPKMIKNE